MLLAITTWVSASRWVERAVASSALSASSAIHCSSRTTAGSAPPSIRSWWRKREMNVGVSAGGLEANRSSSRSSAPSPATAACAIRVAALSAAASSSSRATVRSAMRRTFSISPSRSMAGIAHSSPMVSVETCWNAWTKLVTLWRSTRPSLWPISVMASS